MDFEAKKILVKKIIDTVLEQAFCTLHTQDNIGWRPDLDLIDWKQVEDDLMQIIQEIEGD